MSISIAMVALGDGAKISPSALHNDLVSTWPDLPAPSKPKKEERTLWFRIGEAYAYLGFMSAPIPWSELEGPCATSWLWPEAEVELRKHRTHVIVTVDAECAPIERSRTLTRATAALVGTCPAALGVYWCDAGLVISPKMFRDFAARILPKGPPLYVWVDFRVGRSKDGKLAGFTVGLSALGHMELETLDSPESAGELRDRFYHLSLYLLENGPVIHDGDTFGQDDDERIRIVYSPSAFGREGQVMRLEYEAAVPSTSPAPGYLDLASLLRSTRTRLRGAQASYGRKNWRNDRIKKPLMLYVIRDRRFNAQFRGQRSLLRRGRVVWGAVVQANNILFQRNGPYAMLPAAIMYSLDSTYDSNPAQLLDHAHKLFDLKRQRCTPEMQAFADRLADEVSADVKLPIPRGFTAGRQCYYATVLIARKHLPRGHLVNGYFPVVVNPDETDAVTVLPRAYWAPDLKRAWAQA